jgi:peptide/nickel transport system substrate-binding protein
MYETLIGFNRYTREYEPTRLATDWSVSQDGTKWTYILRQDIPFHDGTEFTARDVVFTWEQYANSMLSGSALMMEVIDGEESFSIPNPHEITWNLNRPEATIGIWTSDMFQWLNYSKDHWDNVGGEEGYAADPIGTGPFRFVSFGENSHIAFEKVDDHWRQTPEMDETEFRYVKEDATRVAMLLAKEAHMSDIPRNLIPQVTQEGYSEVYSTVPGFIVFLMFGGQYYYQPPGWEDKFDPTSPLTNTDVRKALSLAIDRDEINRVFFDGKADYATAFKIHPTDAAYNERWAPDPFDPDAAMALLVDAGYPNGFELEFVASKKPGLSEGPEISETIAQYWRDIGVTVELKEIEYAEMLSMGRTWELQRHARLEMHGFFSYEMSLTNNLKVTATEDRARGGMFAHEVTDGLVREIEFTVDPGERLQKFRELGDFLYDQRAILPLYWVLPVAAYDAGIIDKYESDFSNQGPTRHWEYAELVKR